MSDELRLAGCREPLGLRVRQGPRIAAWPDLRTQELEFSSRGDRVTGRAILPADGAGPHPLVLVQHALGGSAAGVLEAVGTSWVEAGAAVASVDFPLHGARADQKLLRLLCDADPDPRRVALALEFARQAVIDLERALDALEATEWIDGERIAYVGFGLGARLGTAFCALDPRPSAAVLAPDGAGPAEPDPARYLGRIAPRPVLLVGTRPDPRPSHTSNAAFASPSPGARVEQAWFEADPADLPRIAAPAIWEFLARQLAL